MNKIDAFAISEHPLAKLNPYSSQEQFETLKMDIDKNGVIVPIVFYRGLLVDGRHRVKAVIELFKGGCGDCKIPYIDLPHKMTLAKVKSHVASLEERRHQTKTQLQCGQWVRLIYNEHKTIREAAELTTTSKSTFSRINSINNHFGINVIRELVKGNKVEVKDNYRRVFTDSITKIVNFISTIDETEDKYNNIKDSYEEKVRLRSAGAKEYLSSLDKWGLESLRREINKIGSM